MRLEVGTIVGRYHILTPLGAGGMGEVYRASDPALDREVALKIIRADRQGESYQRRFEHEAKAASALNHPHVASVFDFGTQDGMLYLVSELVQGRTLRETLRTGALSIAEAVSIAEQIANALGAAHQAGIVHRDLKPENVLVAADRIAKIVDFGTAKLTQGTADNDATATMLTAPGEIIGTTAYMSPEQVRGADVNFRSDQFSFGVVLFEMLTGKCPFSRPTTAETASAILNDEPARTDSAQTIIPEPIRWILERCLAKDPAFRYASTYDLYLDVKAVGQRLQKRPHDPASLATRNQSSTFRWLGAGVLIASAAMGLGWWWMWSNRGIDAGAFRFTPLAMQAGYEGYPAWSPDGKMLAYVGEVSGIVQVFKRSVGALVPDQLTREASNCSGPIWSPDGTRIYFVRDGALWSIGAGGGRPDLVHQNVQRATISPDGLTLAITRRHAAGQGGLWLASPPAAEPRRYTEPPFSKRTFIIADVQFSPDGKKIGLGMISGQQPPEFWILPFPSGTPKQLQFLSNLAMSHPFSWMPDSRHVVVGVQLSMINRSQLWMADTVRDRIQPISISTASLTNPAVSPDGRTLAVTADQSDVDILEIQPDSRSVRPMLATPANEHSPVWLPSGEGFIYISDRTGVQEIWLRTRGVDSALIKERDFPSGRTFYLAGLSLSKDGQRVAFTRRVYGGTTAIWIASVSGGSPVRLLSEEVSHRAPTWSPDGNWIAYLSTSGGSSTLLKRRIGASGDSQVLRTDVEGSTPPAWSPDGQWVLYAVENEMRVVSADGKRDRLLSKNSWLTYVWSMDGKVIYGVRDVDRHYSLVVLDIKTNSERELFDLQTGSGPTLLWGWPPAGRPEIQPDAVGRSFLATLHNRKADIWLLEGFHTRLSLLRTPWRDRTPD